MAGGIDPRIQPIPVAPAVHYHMGGIGADLAGQTSLEGLFAVGECASTGVHGANRLASNSLLEAVVFGARIAADLFLSRVDTRPGDRADDRRIGRARGHRDRVQHLTFGVRCLFGAPEEQHRQSFGQAAHAAHIRERAGVFAFDNDAGPEDPSRRFLDVCRIPAAARDDVGDGLLR